MISDIPVGNRVRYVNVIDICAVSDIRYFSRHDAVRYLDVEVATDQQPTHRCGGTCVAQHPNLKAKYQVTPHHSCVQSAWSIRDVRALTTHGGT